MHGYWLYLTLSVNPTARFAGPVSIGITCYGTNFRAEYNCSLHRDLGARWDAPADEAAFQVFQAVLDRFQSEAIPRLAEVFGETPETFYQHSYAAEYSREFDV